MHLQNFIEIIFSDNQKLSSIKKLILLGELFRILFFEWAHIN